MDIIGTSFWLTSSIYILFLILSIKQDVSHMFILLVFITKLDIEVILSIVLSSSCQPWAGFYQEQARD